MKNLKLLQRENSTNIQLSLPLRVFELKRWRRGIEGDERKKIGTLESSPNPLLQCFIPAHKGTLSFFYVVFFITMLLVSACQPTSQALQYELTSNKGYEVGPVEITLPEAFSERTSLSLKSGDQLLPLQKLEGNQWIFILDMPLEAGSSNTYDLVEEIEEGEGVEVVNSDENISVKVGEKPVLTYHTAIQMPPEGKPEYYQKSGFIHPLYSPDGQVLTDGFPEGHMHQHGIFFAWVKTTFEEDEIDFWNQQKETGTVTHVEVLDTKSGPVFGEFKVSLEHLVLKNKPDTVRALNEIWTVRVYAISDYFLIDLFSEQQLASGSPLIMEEYHYGGFGIRANAQWFDVDYEANPENPVNYLGVGEGGFLTSEGKTRIEGNHSRPNWVDFHGKIDGQFVGMTTMGHPDNFRFPQPVRLHPSMPYFCFAPSVLGQFSIEPGKTYSSAYRIFVHQGETDNERIEKEWKAYTH